MEQARQLTDRLMDALNAEKPSKAQLAQLRKALEDTPTLVGLLGDLSQPLKRRIVASIAHQPGFHITVQAKADQLTKELGAGQGSPLERLLIEHVVVAWLRLQSMEWDYQHNFEQNIALTKGVYLERRLSAAHRRYLQAIESLVRVRGLLRRAPVQINIAQQQIVASG